IRAGTPNNDPFREEFVRGMRDLGYVEGRNIAYEFRHYGDDVESIPSLIGNLLSAKVDVIVAGGIPAIALRRQQHRTSPSSWERRPIPWAAAWLQAWRARPPTFSMRTTELRVKGLELLKEVMRQAVRIAILQRPDNPAHPMFIKEIEPTAGVLGFTYRILEVRGSEDFEPTFTLMRAWAADATFV